MTKIKKIQPVIFILLIMSALLILTTGCSTLYRIGEFPNWKSQLTEEEKNNLSNTVNISDKRSDYDSDEQFANFRPLKGGNLKDNYIFRGASPYLENSRTPYVNRFLGINNIQYVVSLSENYSAIEEKVYKPEIYNLYFSYCWRTGYIKDEPEYYDWNIDLSNKEHVDKLINSLSKLSNSKGNIYIHCAIGRDRTGVYCEILEALAGSSYQEIVNDYMKSFENYSFISKEKNPGQYNYIKTEGVDKTLRTLANCDEKTNLENQDWKKITTDFLLNSNMPKEILDNLINKICN